MSSDKVKLYCHFGGNIIREAGEINYNGGTVRVIVANRMISYDDLVSKICSICKLELNGFHIKYQFPSENMGILPLISIEEEYDVRIMMDSLSENLNDILIFILRDETIPVMATNNRHDGKDTSVGGQRFDGTEIIQHAASDHNRSQESEMELDIGSRGFIDIEALSDSPRDQNQELVELDRSELLVGNTVSLAESSSLASHQNTEQALTICDNTPSTLGLVANQEPTDVPTSKNAKIVFTSHDDILSTTRLVDDQEAMDISNLHSVKLEIGGGNISSVLGEGGRMDYSLKLGQEFSNVDAFRNALRTWVIIKGFEICFLNNYRRCVTAMCKGKNKEGEKCTWRIHASKLQDVSTFKIKTLNIEHSCNKFPARSSRLASKDWIAAYIQQRLRDNLDYKPNHIILDIQQNFGIVISYHKAWRGREEALKLIRGSFEDAFHYVPSYCKQIEKTNPGSIANLICHPNSNMFHRLFITFEAQIQGFLTACRPILALDGTFLKGKYTGVMLWATSIDANDETFPLAFAVAEDETKQSWTWFLEELHRFLGHLPRITILSNRSKDLVEGVGTIFPNAFHGYCMHHLCEILKKMDKSEEIKNLFYLAATAYTRRECIVYVREIEQFSIRAYQWIANIDLKCWATSYFEGDSYMHLVPDMEECFNNWIKDAQELPIIPMLESIRSRLMKLFYIRRKNSLEWKSQLTPRIQNKLHGEAETARGYRVEHASTTELGVYDGNAKHIVDIENRACSCHGWQVEGFPCSHALAALTSRRLNIEDYCHECFTVAKYREAYAGIIHPILDEGQWDDEGAMLVQPPPLRRGVGRPKKNPIRTEVERGQSVHCKNCKQIGHNRRTCPGS